MIQLALKISGQKFIQQKTIQKRELKPNLYHIPYTK